MKVKMKTTASGATWAAGPGEYVDVTKEEAKALCSGGYAVPVKAGATEKATSKAPETSSDKGGKAKAAAPKNKAKEAPADKGGAKEKK